MSIRKMLLFKWFKNKGVVDNNYCIYVVGYSFALVDLTIFNKISIQRNTPDGSRRGSY